MRVVIADCELDYTGRGDTRGERATRAIIIKADGSVSIHSDKSNKPMNYMGDKNVMTESTKYIGDKEVLLWQFDLRRENLTITMHQVFSDSKFALSANDSGLERDGTENHLQEWLADNPHELGGNYELIQREYQTGAGPVDLLVRDSMTGEVVAVEVKRVAMIPAVDQVKRYVEALNETEEHGVVKGLIVALDIRPKTIELAEKRGIPYHVVRTDWKDLRKSHIEQRTLVA